MSLAGLIPTVVTAGIATKFADHALSPARRVKITKRKKIKARATRRTTYPNSKYAPF